MNEFALSNGKVGKGLLGALGASVKFLIVPVLIISIVISLMGEMGGDMIPMDWLELMRISFILFAIPVIVLAFFVGFYPKGSYSRMIFGLIYVAFICVWLWFALQGGKIDADLDMAGVGIDFTPLLLLFILVASLRGVFFLAEAPSYRKEFLERCDQKEEVETPADTTADDLPSPAGEEKSAVEDPAGEAEPENRSEPESGEIVDPMESGPSHLEEDQEKGKTGDL